MGTKQINSIWIAEDQIKKLQSEESSKLIQFIKKSIDLLEEDFDYLIGERFISLKNKKIIYDHEVMGVYPQFWKYKAIKGRYNESTEQRKKRAREHYGEGIEWDLANENELIRTFTLHDKSPFKTNQIRITFETNKTNRVSYFSDEIPKWIDLNNKDNSSSKTSIVQNSTGSIWGVLGGSFENSSFNEAMDSINNYPFIPIFRLKTNKKSSNLDIMYEFMKNKWIPSEIINENLYRMVMNEVHNFNLKDLKLSKEDIQKIKNNYENEKKIQLPIEKIIEKYISSDKKRADIKEYNSKILEDINGGHWELWEENYEKDGIEVKLKTPFVARNPTKDIVDGVVGIDFGTKSTVVVRQKDNFHKLPMRIGVGDISKKEESFHYENPTMVEFIDYRSFKKSYDKKVGRPETEWGDIVVSHSAYNSMLETKSSYFNSYFGELKQWCGDKDKKIKVIDKKGYIEELSPYLKVENGMDPIEIYAYYLGLYINNMHNGIYMKYYLSFPATYELEIRNKIIDSFNKGLKKSLPVSILNDNEVMKKFEVNCGASEPAAYAITAFKEYNFKPIDEEKEFYGVFDFGGGTTDFDFGIWREGNGAKERRFDYVIEHFGSGGDRYLGGENILELLAFEIFKKNRDALRKAEISFTLPPECREFSGSEILLSDSREANLNMKTLMMVLRPLWEKREGYEKTYKDGELKVDLWKQNGESLKKVELECNLEEVETIIRKRIEEGIKKFFNSLRLAFGNKKINLNNIDKVNIFLAGNSCKADIVEEIFNEYIEKEVKRMKKKENDIFSLYPPLGSEKAYEIQEMKGLKVDRDTLETPTGKTGVAFGLISSRKGSKIKVIDHNISNDINFRYYLGEEKRGKFKVTIDRMVPYGEWVEFIDAGYEDFEILFSDNPIVSTNNIEVVDTSVKKKALKIDVIDEDAMVYIRKASPTAIEYVVASEEGIKNDEYIGKVTKVDIA